MEGGRGRERDGDREWQDKREKKEKIKKKKGRGMFDRESGAKLKGNVALYMGETFTISYLSATIIIVIGIVYLAESLLVSLSHSRKEDFSHHTLLEKQTHVRETTHTQNRSNEKRLSIKINVPQQVQHA